MLLRRWWKINKAFAGQVLAVLKEIPLPLEKLNVNGGAVALGHPIGCSGARILVTLLHEMRRREIDLRVATLCGWWLGNGRPGTVCWLGTGAVVTRNVSDNSIVVGVLAVDFGIKVQSPSRF